MDYSKQSSLNVSKRNSLKGVYETQDGRIVTFLFDHITWRESGLVEYVTHPTPSTVVVDGKQAGKILKSKILWDDGSVWTKVKRAGKSILRVRDASGNLHKRTPSGSLQPVKSKGGLSFARDIKVTRHFSSKEKWEHKDSDEEESSEEYSEEDEKESEDSSTSDEVEYLPSPSNDASEVTPPLRDPEMTPLPEEVTSPLPVDEMTPLSEESWHMDTFSSVDGDDSDRLLPSLSNAQSASNPNPFKTRQILPALRAMAAGEAEGLSNGSQYSLTSADSTSMSAYGPSDTLSSMGEVSLTSGTSSVTNSSPGDPVFPSHGGVTYTVQFTHPTGHDARQYEAPKQVRKSMMIAEVGVHKAHNSEVDQDRLRASEKIIARASVALQKAENFLIALSLQKLKRASDDIQRSDDKLTRIRAGSARHIGSDDSGDDSEEFFTEDEDVQEKEEEVKEAHFQPQEEAEERRPSKVVKPVQKKKKRRFFRLGANL